LKLWLWDIPFYLASFCATMWFNIIFEHVSASIRDGDRIPCWGVTEVPIHLRAAQEDFNVIVLKGFFHQIASNK